MTARSRGDEPKDIVEFLVDTPNPDALDFTLQTLGAVLVGGGGAPGGYERRDGHYVVRCLNGEPGFVRYAISSQGYARIVKEGKGENG